MEERYETFESVEERLRAIVDEVSREDISLDDALQLYEEAAKLTGVACTLSEQGIEELYPSEGPEAADGEPQPAAMGGAPQPDAAPAAAEDAAAAAPEAPDAAEQPEAPGSVADEALSSL